MFFINFFVSGLKIEIKSDFLLLKNTNDHLFYDPRSGHPDLKIYIHRIDHEDRSEINISDKLKRFLKATVDFPERWLENPVFTNSKFVNILKMNISNPEMVHIALNWNRIAIRNYENSEYHFFFPESKEHEFNSLLFIARLRNMLFGSFLKFNSAMIHSAGVVIDNKTAVLLAPDEGGKSTAVSLFPGDKILSDDHLILSNRDQRTIVHGTPFGMITSGPEKEKLGGFFILEKGEKFNLTPINSGEILQFIWSDQFQKWFPLPKNMRVKAFDLLNHICKEVPGYRMTFPKDHINWDSVKKAMEP